MISLSDFNPTITALACDNTFALLIGYKAILSIYGPLHRQNAVTVLLVDVKHIMTVNHIYYWPTKFYDSVCLNKQALALHGVSVLVSVGLGYSIKSLMIPANLEVVKQIAVENFYPSDPYLKDLVVAGHKSAKHTAYAFGGLIANFWSGLWEAGKSPAKIIIKDTAEEIIGLGKTVAENLKKK